jgi:hypothetical protein
MLPLSPVAYLMVRPFRGYERIARAEGDDAPTVIAGVARLLFVVGAFVALGATGRLAPLEVVGGMLSFAYVPIVHAVALYAALRLFARHVSLARAYALYCEGQGPWLLLMCAAAGVCLFAPEPARLLGAVAAAMWIAYAWGIVLTFACLRRGLGLSRLRSLGATFVFYLVVHIVVLGYFLAAGQLRPILPW